MSPADQIPGIVPVPPSPPSPFATWYWVVLGFLAVAMALRAPLLGNPVLHVDEQFYLLVGDRMLHGALPYVDIWDRKPIGLFLLFAGFRLLGGDGVWCYQIAAIASVTATAYVIYRIARQIAQARAARERNALLAKTRVKRTLEDFLATVEKGEVQELKLIIKGDVSGSVEALEDALIKVQISDEVILRVLHRGVGAINKSDVTLAAASDAIVIGFNVRPNAKARELVERFKVRMKYFDVIYHLTEEIAKEMAGVWGPERIETVVGRAEVKEVFPAGKHDKAAGLLVLEGFIKKGLYARLTRNDVIVSKTHIKSLRRFKDDVAEVRAGLEGPVPGFLRGRRSGMSAACRRPHRVRERQPSCPGKLRAVRCTEPPAAQRSEPSTSRGTRTRYGTDQHPPRRVQPHRRPPWANRGLPAAERRAHL